MLRNYHLTSSVFIALRFGSLDDTCPRWCPETLSLLGVAPPPFFGISQFTLVFTDSPFLDSTYR